MSKVLIDRELLSVASLHLEYSGYTETGKKLRALLDTPSGTPAMPVKAYYHEWTDLEGVRTRSVGLEVRKEFTDAPLVLEADALARIACLEGEIAKRDEELAACRVAVENCEVFRARIAELEADRDSHQRCAIQAMAELAAIKAQEQVAYIPVDRKFLEEIADSLDYDVRDVRDKVRSLLAAPVSEAKAQGVVQWPEADEIMQMAFEEGQPADDASGYCFELEEFDLFIERLMSEVARLNAAPVQQVSAPDDMRSLAQRLREYNQNPHHINPMSEAFHILVADAANALSTACVPKEIAAAITWSEHLLFECGALTSTRAPSVHVYNKTFAAVNEARAMLAADPAAPAADAGLVEALDYQVLFDAIAAATSVYANGAVNISVQVFRDALAAHRAKGVV